jgi:pimeloyl-ACP methyl ester carboxylesterase
MVRKILLVFVLAFVSLNLHSQDLILTNNLVGNNLVGLLEQINLKIKVKNIGTSFASKSHTSIYISNTPTFDNAILLSTISCEALAPNQETSDIDFVYPIPANCKIGNNYILVKVDSKNEVLETNENNDFSFSQLISISSFNGQQNLPYPIIFVHGLNSEYKIWDSLVTKIQNFYGWSKGGNMNFCLNQDNNTATSNSINDYRDWTVVSNLYPKGDFFTVNFNVDTYGNSLSSQDPFESNESAITKQGLAIRDAISHVLQITKRDKVILVGHSMGGLASREYLQNTSIWQIDGNHHVAKLLTIGTPHGGSNATFGPLSPIASLLGEINELGEATRDLRTSYYSTNKGAYLFGGTESNTSIFGFLSNFSNVDVNCNGILGDNIIGLNQKNLQNNLNYSCIIGDGNILGGDGVVSTYSANLKNFYALPIDTFVIRQPFPYPYPTSKIWHSALIWQYEAVMKGLDESNEYNNSYSIDLNKTYFGLFTNQSATGYTFDYDDYKISIQQSGILNVKLKNIPIGKCYFNLLNSSKTIIFSDSTNGHGYYEFKKNISPGVYYIELYAKPDNDSWYFPYALNVSIDCQTSTISTTGNLIACMSNPPNLTSNFNSGNQWYLNNIPITGANSSNLIPNISGSYTLVTTINGCVSKPSAPVSVIINQNPVKPIIYRDLNNNLVSSSITGNQWFSDTTSIINGQISQSYKPTLGGYYATKVTFNNCSSSFSDKYYYLVTDLANFNNDEYIHMYPNPASNVLIVDYNLNGISLVTVKILDANGKIVINESNISNSSKLNVSHLMAGVYFIQVIDKNNRLLFTEKLIKK